MDILIDHHHRRQGAAAKAGHVFQAKLAIFRGVAGFDLKLVFHPFQDAAAAPNVTSRSQANLD